MGWRRCRRSSLSVTQAVAAPFVDPATLDQLGGRIDATVQLDADRVALERVRGTITLDQAELTLGGIALDQQTTTRVSIREGRLTVDAWEWGRGDNRLAVRGGRDARRELRRSIWSRRPCSICAC